MRIHRGHSLRLAILIGIFLSVISGLTISQAATFKIPAGDVEALIAAINTANGNGEADTIKLAAGTYTLTEVDNITEGQNGLPSITSKITIKGVNANRTIIRRDINAPQFRILFISESGHLILKKVTITGGFLREPGGGLSNWGGGIHSNGRVELFKSNIINNEAGEWGGVFSTGFTYVKHSAINNNIEGGISSYSLVIKNSEVSNNTNGGIESRSLKASHIIVSNNIVEEGYANRIGGIKANFHGGSVTISDSIITNNVSDAVSGIAIGGGPDGGPLSITNSIIRGNISRSSVGGIAQGYGSLTYPTLIIKKSTISENIGGGISVSGPTIIIDSTINENIANRGGGISHFDAYNNRNILTIINSTISGNRTIGEDPYSPSGGGGIYNDGSTIEIFNSTITNNHSLTTGGGILNRSYTNDIMVKNSIIAGNTSSQEEDNDCYSRFTLPGRIYTSLGRNIVGAGTGCPSDGPGDIVVAPDEVFTQILGPLQDNGGPTETHALLTGSPAIDAGETVCTNNDDNPLTTDQRGALRPVDGNSDGVAACDIGAFELQMETPPALASPCEIVAANGEVTGFEANGQEVKLPKELHKRIDWARTQAEYQLLLYTWHGSTTPFAEAQGRLDLEPDTQVKKIKCEAL